MSRAFAICQRELTYFYNSIAAYVVTMVLVFLAGYFFYNLLAFFNLASFQNAQNILESGRLSLTESVMQPYFANLSVVLLLVAPMLTMRLLSEERRLGTAELLFTYPISDWDAILGKFMATVIVLAAALAVTLVLPLLLAGFAAPEWGPIATGYAGLLLLGMAYISVGIFFSSLSENQIVAGVLSFGFSLLVLIIGWLIPFVSAGPARVLSEISMLGHFDGFSRGIVNTNDIVYYVNFSVFFLFLCSRVLESNRWRS